MTYSDKVMFVLDRTFVVIALNTDILYNKNMT